MSGAQIHASRFSKPVKSAASITYSKTPYDYDPLKINWRCDYITNQPLVCRIETKNYYQQATCYHPMLDIDSSSQHLYTESDRNSHRTGR